MQRILTNRIKELRDVSLDVMDLKLNYSSTLQYLELTASLRSAIEITRRYRFFHYFKR